MHAIGQSCPIGIPHREITSWFPFTKKVLMCHLGPNEIIRSEHLEEGGHRPGIEYPLVPHHVLKERHLTFVDEQHEFTGFAKVGLGCKERARAQPIVVIARHCCSGDGQ